MRRPVWASDDLLVRVLAIADEIEPWDQFVACREACAAAGGFDLTVNRVNDVRASAARWLEVSRERERRRSEARCSECGDLLFSDRAVTCSSTCRGRRLRRIQAERKRQVA